ncbi:MAG: STAS domain-containing protein [Actinocatenispora sp.]
MTSFSPTPLHTELTHTTGYSVLALIGDLDAATTVELRTQIDALTATGTRRIVLDLGPLRYATTSGLYSLAEAHRTCRGAGVDLVMADPQPLVATALLLTDVTDDIACYDTVHAAGTADPDQLRRPGI